MSKKAIITFAVVGIFVAGLLVPFETVIVPDWIIRFVDENGNPVSGVHVEEVCQHYSYTEVNVCAGHLDSRQVTDGRGLVTFSRKTVRYSLASRAIRTVFYYLTLLAHGSVGINAYLIVNVPQGYKSVGIINYDPTYPPSHIVLEPSANGKSE